MLTRLACILILTLASAAGVARAQSERELAAARDLILEARFSEAVTAARQILERTDLSAADRNATLELLAVAQLANRQQREAQETLALLYSRDPGHRLTDPDASPPVISAFARAREAEPPQIPVRIEHAPPTLTVRQAPELRVRLGEGADAVAELRLVYRIGAEAPSRVVMTQRADGSYIARIPVVGDASSATDVAYHIVALAPSLAPLASAGSAAEPLQLRIPAESRASAPPPAQAEQPPSSRAPDPAPAPAPAGGSVAEEWWFWTLIAVLVIGGAVTAGVLLGPGQQGPEPGSLGSVRLMSIEWP